MAKRGATSDLNHDNWDREEDPEDAGTFAKASEDVLKKRVIKVAKRRNPISSTQNDDEKNNAFGGFTGFAKSAPTSNTAPFGFLSGLAKSGDSKTAKTPEKTKSDEYYAKLKGLNENVCEWIKKHVAANPFISLQPVFKDYDNYFAELEKMKGEIESEKAPETSKPETNPPKFSFASATPPKSTLGANSAPNTTNATATTFSFGVSTAPSSTTFSFGAKSTPSTTGTFSFGSSTTTTASTLTLSGNSTPNNSDKSGDVAKPFSFGSPSDKKFSFVSTVIKPADREEAQNEEENEDEPPKVEFKPVVEEGHVYSIRCKVFVKKDGSFGDRGVGNLYLKPVPDSEKVQLIVRADTNLGNLLCNFILSEGIPMQRMGKKDVMLVCLPTPETKPPPVPILLRVKTTEDADELLKTLEKHKK